VSRYILTMDPGLTTGVALYDREQDRFHSDQLDFNGTCAFLMQQGSHKGEDLVIVSESFIITQQTPKNTQAPWSLELIGVARMVSRTWCGRDLHKQDPASAKRFASDARLKHLGWHKPGKGHANDAARHLLLLLATRAWIPQSTLAELTEV
jgi:hypothetical protein